MANHDNACEVQSMKIGYQFLKKKDMMFKLLDFCTDTYFFLLLTVVNYLAYEKKKLR